MTLADSLPSGSPPAAATLPVRCRMVTGLDLADVRLMPLQVPRQLRGQSLQARMEMEAVRLSGRPFNELHLDYIQQEVAPADPQRRDFLLAVTLRQAVARHCDRWEEQGIRPDRVGIRVLALEQALAWVLREDGQPLPDALGALHADDRALYLVILEAGAGRYWQSWPLYGNAPVLAGEGVPAVADTGPAARVAAVRQALAQIHRQESLSMPQHWVLLGNRLSDPEIHVQLTDSGVQSPRTLFLGPLLTAGAVARVQEGQQVEDFWIAFGLALQGVQDGRH